MLRSKENHALQIAREVARKAGEKTKPLFGKITAVYAKESPTDLCSEADLLAEKIIHQELTNQFPDFNYLSEEHELVDRGSEYTWVIDPLDGSTPFVSGLTYWAVSIGLLKGKEPVVGVINIPAKGWVFSAGKKGGALLNGKLIKVSSQDKYDQTMIGFDVGHRGFRREDLIRNVVPQIEKVRYMPCFACASFGQVLVAMGVYDAYLHHRAYPWDFCAGTIIVQEAGGKITDHEGKPLDWTQKDNMFLLASNGLLHNQILETITSK